MRPTHLPLALRALLAVLAAVAVAPAQGASRLVVRGAGFGHGIGMSQYGAFGFAAKGVDHGAILRHYYSGAQIGTLAGGGEVRVLLKTAGRIVFDSATRVAGGRKLDPARRYVATRGLSGGDHAAQRPAAASLGSYASPLAIDGRGRRPAGVRAQRQRRRRRALPRQPRDPRLVAGRRRGDQRDRASTTTSAASSPARCPPAGRRRRCARRPSRRARTRWRRARTATASTSTPTRARRSTTGSPARRAATDEAVAATAGEIVAYDGKPIVTYYFSTSGGRTENVENVFIGAEPAPYLTSVEDPYDDASPRHTLGAPDDAGARRSGASARSSRARCSASACCAAAGRRASWRRRSSARGGRTSVSGPTLRRKLGLYDTWARFTVITANATRGDGNTPAAATAPVPAGARRARDRRRRSARPARRR